MDERTGAEWMGGRMDAELVAGKMGVAEQREVWMDCWGEVWFGWWRW